MIRILVATSALLAIPAGFACAGDEPLPRALVDTALKKAACTVPREEASVIGTQALDGKLRLVEVRCWTAAYQAGTIFFAMAPAAPDKARLLRFPEWNGKKGLSATYSLTDADFSEGSKIMTMRHKGRGVGDCGSAGEWKWIGSDFKLTGYWHQEKCDGREFDTEGRKYKVFPRRR